MGWAVCIACLSEVNLINTSRSRSCIVLVDAHDRVIAVLGGVPRGSKGAKWQAVEAEAAAAAVHCRESSTFTAAQKQGRHGEFASQTVGYGYGNGQCNPKNYKVSGRANQSAIQELLQNTVIWRISGFQNALLNTFCHKNYAEYRDTNNRIQSKQPKLHANFPKTAFAVTTFNLGPLLFPPPHMDPENRASSWCADTNMGPFNPDKGRHLVLWDLGLIIHFPPGSTILFPSALINPSTIPIQAHESRYMMIQYSSGGLF
ncbi:hypothetical protein EV359DRAFT_52281 [Lentinula novae-zelandiae]|nr:hypothetical protein EV359DRAFT_52281 [Lentinula novae-zelandiae]